MSGARRILRILRCSPAADSASIRYTLDGSWPTATTGVLYDGTPISIPASATLRAVAFRNGIATSVVAEATFQILAPELVGLEFEGDDLRVFWRTVGGTLNQLEVTDSLAAGFENLGPELFVSGTGATVTNYLDIGGAIRGATRLFRVQVLP